MSRYDKIFSSIVDGNSDANISFDDIVNLLKRLGFDMRVKASHHTFRLSGVEELINLQKDGSKAKPYQVRQVRKILITYHLKENL